jgi:ribonuclease P protein component
MQRQFCLRRSADFEHVRAQGRVWRHPFVMLSMVRNDLAHNRYGFITSRRLGSAVVRNRVRRVLREVVRLASPKLRQGFDVVFIARNEILDQPYSEVKEVLDQLFRRADLLERIEPKVEPNKLSSDSKTRDEAES